MTDEAPDDDFDDEEEPGQSLALPPLYVLRTVDYCPACGKAGHVFALGCASFFDAWWRAPIEQFHFLRYITRLDDAVLRMIRRKCPQLAFDSDGRHTSPYLMNHCACGEKLDDDLLHGDVGAAFYPDTPEGFGCFRLYRLPVEQPVEVECNMMIGGGDYLDYGNIEEW